MIPPFNPPAPEPEIVRVNVEIEFDSRDGYRARGLIELHIDRLMNALVENNVRDAAISTELAGKVVTDDE